VYLVLFLKPGVTEDLYQHLSTKEGEKDIYRMTRAHDRKMRDFNQVKCTKDEMEQFLVKENEIKHRWKDSFDKLFNGENENTIVQLENSFDDTNGSFVWRIQELLMLEKL
jgi:succinate dehydrogenase/fumarate reductase flavoprotein subunit